MAQILIIEDDALISDYLASVLARAGHEVVVAANGEEGLEKYRQSTVELIITDLHMPRMNGAAFIKSIRDAGVAEPIIVLTANPEELGKLPEGSIQGLRSKPIGPEQFLTWVEGTLERCRSSNNNSVE